MFGNCATGRLTIVTPPTITIRMAITIATMGRLMKNFDMVSDVWRLGRLVGFVHSCLGQHRRNVGLGSHNTALLRLLSAFYDDPFARLEALFDDPHVAKEIADLHRPDADLV